MDTASHPTKVDLKGMSIAIGLSLLAVVLLWVGLRWCSRGFRSAVTSASHEMCEPGQPIPRCAEPRWKIPGSCSSGSLANSRYTVSKVPFNKEAASGSLTPTFSVAKSIVTLHHSRSKKARVMRLRTRLARARSVKGRRSRGAGRVLAPASTQSEEDRTLAFSAADFQSRRRRQRGLSLTFTPGNSYGEAQAGRARMDSFCTLKNVGQSADRHLFGLHMLQRAATVRFERSGSFSNKKHAFGEYDNRKLVSASSISRVSQNMCL